MGYTGPLADKDRIFTNLYGLHPWGLKEARRRGNWDGTAAIIASTLMTKKMTSVHMLVAQSFSPAERLSAIGLILSRRRQGRGRTGFAGPAPRRR